jgi:hypothetical protein
MSAHLLPDLALAASAICVGMSAVTNNRWVESLDI